MSIKLILSNTWLTDASCEINEANERRVMSPDDSCFRCSCHLSRISYDARFLPMKLFLYTSLRFGVSYLLRSPAFIHSYGNATCTRTQTPTHRHARVRITLTWVLSRAGSPRALTHACRTQHSFDKYM